jgi:sporulation protein YlmC with PRC-barrel domain
MHQHHARVLQASKLTGDTVRNPQGENLGDIKDFMIDLENGNIVYAVLSFGGFLGMGDKLFAIPWDSLRIDAERDTFILDVSRAQLDNAPGFDRNNWPERPDMSFVNRVYTHYGYDPYYDETGRVRSRSTTSSLGRAMSGTTEDPDLRGTRSGL